jgi:hypothetical protein
MDNVETIPINLNNLLLHKHVYLDEANVLGVAAEALPAAHQPILPDETMRVRTDPAAKTQTCSRVTKAILLYYVKYTLRTYRIIGKKMVHVPHVFNKSQSFRNRSPFVLHRPSQSGINAQSNTTNIYSFIKQ